MPMKPITEMNPFGCRYLHKHTHTHEQKVHFAVKRMVRLVETERVECYYDDSKSNDILYNVFSESLIRYGTKK